MKLIDLSQVIEDCMPVYPGDMKTELVHSKHLDTDKYNNHRLSISMHAGTHIDGPMHMTSSNMYIDDVPLDSCMGTGCLLDVRNEQVICMKPEYEQRIPKGSIVLLYTGWSMLYGKPEYYEKHPVVEMSLCDFLLENKIRMLGMDIPSPDRHPFTVHQALFDNNVYIIENLTNLDRLLEAEHFEIMAFPLKVRADSSMARVVARIP